ncbi:hypothetical protein JNUCC74_10510 [Cerasibacillus sp. JNUCC 74]
MEKIVDLIFSNIFVVLAIVAGVIGFFKNSISKEQEAEKKDTRPKRQNRPTSPFGGEMKRQWHDPTKRRQLPKKEAPTMTNTTSTQELKPQMDQLVQQVETSFMENVDEFSSSAHSTTLNRSLKSKPKSDQLRTKMKRQVSSNLTQKGLVNGIIMAEVFGPPRAKKPYRSVLAERRK